MNVNFIKRHFIARSQLSMLDARLKRSNHRKQTESATIKSFIKFTYCTFIFWSEWNLCISMVIVIKFEMKSDANFNLLPPQNIIVTIVSFFHYEP